MFCRLFVHRHSKTNLSRTWSYRHYDLRKDFKGFLAHAIKLCKAFQLADNGPSTKSAKTRKKTTGGDRRKKGDKDDNDNEKNPKGGNDGNDTTINLFAPVCLWPPHKSKGIRHFLRDCMACPNDGKSDLMKVSHDEEAVDGPAENTRL